MEPIEALQRIAYLLEASQAPSHKVRAFRTAARVVAEQPEEVASLAAQGRLTQLKGIGDTTATVISQALACGEPTYLARLGEDADLPSWSDPAEELRRSLLGDCHSHSDWSDGGATIMEMATAARALDRRYQVLTDHSPRLTVAHGLDAERLRRQLDVVAEVNEGLAPFRLLTGIEVDILEDGSLDQEEELLAELDLVVASAHSKLRMEGPAMTARLVRAIESPHTDVLGHCTGRIIVGKGRPESTFDADEVFDACARTGTAVEINSRPERRDPPEPLLRRAVRAGCLFSIDTDAHAPGQLEWLGLGCEQAVQADVPQDRIVNRWPLDELLAWTASHAARPDTGPRCPT